MEQSLHKYWPFIRSLLITANSMVFLLTSDQNEAWFEFEYAILDDEAPWWLKATKYVPMVSKGIFLKHLNLINS